MNAMETIFGSVIAAVSGGLGWLAVRVVAFIKESRDRHEKCEADKDVIIERLHKVEVKQAFFDGCSSDPCPARASMARASFSIQPTNPPQL